jgi:prepilin-type N-terminal cleavage/methylation domain-containing protein
MMSFRNRLSTEIRRQGLTLMELVVVLVILVAIAGILLPLLPRLLTKTHDAVTTTNISEVSKSMVGYLATNLSYPDMFDSLVDSSGNMYAGLLFNSNNPVSQNTFTPVGSVATTGNGTQGLYTATPTTGQIASLQLGGINNLMLMSTSTSSPPAFNATFPNPGGTGPYVGMPNSGGSQAVGQFTNLLFADNNYIAQKLNIQPKTDSTGAVCNYVVLGLGPYCTIIGASNFGMFDAPVAFGEHSFEQPDKSYSRYLCVFRVYSDGTRCEFVAAAHDDATGLGTYDMHMQEYYDTNK